MNMDISTFFEFPGVLITIGITLLIMSIILMIIAYKIGDQPVKSYNYNFDDSMVEEMPTKKNDEKKEQKIEEKELDLTKIYNVSENTETVVDIENTENQKQNQEKFEEKAPKDANQEEEEEIELL